MTDHSPGEGRVSDRSPVKVQTGRAVSHASLAGSFGRDVLNFERGQLRQELMRDRTVSVFWDSIQIEETVDGQGVTLRAYGYGYANE